MMLKHVGDDCGKCPISVVRTTKTVSLRDQKADAVTKWRDEQNRSLFQKSTHTTIRLDRLELSTCLSVRCCDKFEAYPLFYVHVVNLVIAGLQTLRCPRPHYLFGDWRMANRACRASKISFA